MDITDHKVKSSPVANMDITDHKVRSSPAAGMDIPVNNHKDLISPAADIKITENKPNQVGRSPFMEVIEKLKTRALKFRFERKSKKKIHEQVI